MPTYEHRCFACEHEWEDFYSIKSNPPEACPKCNTKGHVKRLISGGSGRGIVELSGNELKEHLKSEGRKLKESAKNNERVASNLEGEASFHRRQLAIDRLKKL